AAARAAIELKDNGARGAEQEFRDRRTRRLERITDAVLRPAVLVGCEAVDLHIRGKRDARGVHEIGGHAAQRRFTIGQARSPLERRKRETREAETERRESWDRCGNPDPA